MAKQKKYEPVKQMVNWNFTQFRKRAKISSEDVPVLKSIIKLFAQEHGFSSIYGFVCQRVKEDMCKDKSLANKRSLSEFIIACETVCIKGALLCEELGFNSEGNLEKALKIYGDCEQEIENMLQDANFLSAFEFGADNIRELYIPKLITREECYKLRCVHYAFRYVCAELLLKVNKIYCSKIREEWEKNGKYF